MIAESSAAAEASPNVLGVRIMYTKNAAAAIAIMPAASPSSPSTRFTAFATATTHRIVSGTATSCEQRHDLEPGIQKNGARRPSARAPRR